MAAICVLSAAGADETSQTPDPEKSFAIQVFGKPTLLRAGVATVLGEIIDSPEEWGRGANGIGKRFAAAHGKHLIRTTVQVGVARLRDEDLRSFPAEEKDFKSRMKHALLSIVMARKTTTGGQTLATGRLAGAFAAGFVSRQWLPDRYHTFSSGMATGGISLGLDAGMNVFREFWPKRGHSKEL